jgi:hypothetical protein
LGGLLNFQLVALDFVVARNADSRVMVDFLRGGAPGTIPQADANDDRVYPARLWIHKLQSQKNHAHLSLLSHLFAGCRCKGKSVPVPQACSGYLVLGLPVPLTKQARRLAAGQGYAFLCAFAAYHALLWCTEKLALRLRDIQKKNGFLNVNSWSGTGLFKHCLQQTEKPPAQRLPNHQLMHRRPLVNAGTATRMTFRIGFELGTAVTGLFCAG